MATFFTSDTHFFHKNVIKYCNRPFSSIEEMNEKMIELHNNTVSPSDEVFFLGDFAFAKPDKILSVLERLNGTKHLILGNHDKDIEHDQKRFLTNKGFSTISYAREIRREGQKICLFHYGCRVWNKSHHGSWHLFGHSHGTLEPFGKSVDVGVDSPFVTGKPEYRPLSFNEIKQFMDKRNVVKVDHHDEDTM